MKKKKSNFYIELFLQPTKNLVVLSKSIRVPLKTSEVLRASVTVTWFPFGTWTFSRWHVLISAERPHFFTPIQQRMFLCLCELAVMENITLGKLGLPLKITVVFLLFTKGSIFCLRKSTGLDFFFFLSIFLLYFNTYLTVSSLFIYLTAFLHNVNSFGEDGN